jgi:hypothetical protein
MKTISIAFVIVTTLAAMQSPSSARTWYVKPDGTGDVPTIQAGIHGAATGDTVVLANGTFRGDGNRDIDYYGKAITVCSESDDPDLCIIDCEGSESDPHRGLYFHSAEGPNSVLEGVTVTNGPGGGAYFDDSSPTIRHCVFVNNQYGVSAGGSV